MLKNTEMHGILHYAGKAILFKEKYSDSLPRPQPPARQSASERLTTRCCRPSASGILFSAKLSSRKGENNGKSGFLARLALHCDFTTVRFDYAGTDRKPEPLAFYRSVSILLVPPYSEASAP